MNYFFMPEDSQLLDRLVDDELTDAERRELLLRLERTPDGWRRCALAFLENQAWRSESKSWASGAPEMTLRPTPAGFAKRGWTGAPIWMPLATAACVLFALGVWVIVRDKEGNEVARIKAPDGSTVTVASVPTSPPSPNMRLVVGGGPNHEGQVVNVPLVDAGRLNEALFGPWSQTLPPEVLQMLERSGHQVVRERQLVPIDLRDGRRVVVPMDQVEIVPVGNVKRFQ